MRKAELEKEYERAMKALQDINDACNCRRSPVWSPGYYLSKLMRVKEIAEKELKRCRS